jgi:hypothetical protein
MAEAWRRLAAQKIAMFRALMLCADRVPIESTHLRVR